MAAGSIAVRRNPGDKRFPQFQLRKQKEEWSKKHEKQKREISDSKSSLEDFTKLAKMKNIGDSLDFTDTEPPPGEQDDLALAQQFLGKGSKHTKPTVDDEDEDEDGDDLDETATQLLAEMETASAAADDAGSEAKLKGSVIKVKSILNSLGDCIEASDKKGKQAVVKDLRKHAKVMDKLKGCTQPKGVIKKALKQAVSLAKKAEKLAKSKD